MWKVNNNDIASQNLTKYYNTYFYQRKSIGKPIISPITYSGVVCFCDRVIPLGIRIRNSFIANSRKRLFNATPHFDRKRRWNISHIIYLKSTILFYNRTRSVNIIHLEFPQFSKLHTVDVLRFELASPSNYPQWGQFSFSLGLMCFVRCSADKKVQEGMLDLRRPCPPTIMYVSPSRATQGSLLDLQRMAVVRPTCAHWWPSGLNSDYVSSLVVSLFYFIL